MTLAHANASDLASGKGSNDENFPVASVLIAPRHRPVVMAFYDFARAADDVADNELAEPAAKLAVLEEMRASLAGEARINREGVVLREVLAAHALTRSFVQRVVDDADDFDVERRVRTATLPQMPAHGALVPEEVPREAAIDDRDFGVLFHIHHGEVAALEHRDPQRREVASRERVHERLHVFAVGCLVTFDGSPIVPFAPAQDRHDGKRRRCQAEEPERSHGVARYRRRYCGRNPRLDQKRDDRRLTERQSVVIDVNPRSRAHSSAYAVSASPAPEPRT